MTTNRLKIASSLIFVFIILISGAFIKSNAQSSSVSWSEDWEGDWTANWYVEGSSWEIGIPTSGPNSSYTGKNCAATTLNRNYSEQVKARLIRKTIFKVPSAELYPRLRFWQWYDFGFYDYGQVQIKIGEGDWEDISNRYFGSGGGTWTCTSLDLSTYADSTVQIGFFFHSNIDIWDMYDTESGWYIDDIALIFGPLIFNNPEGWEAGLGDWNSENGTWEVGVPTSGPGRAYNGNNCAATVLSGNYCENVDTRLTSPQFKVPSADQYPRLRFWHWFSFSYYNFGEVQIKVGKGDWVTISNQYCGRSLNAWTCPNLDLYNYADSTVQIAFYFHSRESWLGPMVSSGWYIDDLILVTGPQIFKNPEDFESGVGEWSFDLGGWQILEPNVGPKSSHSAKHCAGVILNTSGPIASRLSTGPIKIPCADKKPFLRFWHWSNFTCCDHGEVEIKIGKSNWKTILFFWRDTTLHDWSPINIDLKAYADSIARFSFYTFTEACWCVSNKNNGWYIDDVEICEIPVTEIVKVGQKNASFIFSQNHPNPFNIKTTINFYLPFSAYLTLKIYNSNGQEITNLIDDFLLNGEHHVNWNAQNYASGVYYYRIISNNIVQTKKLLLIK